MTYASYLICYFAGDVKSFGSKLCPHFTKALYVMSSFCKSFVHNFTDSCNTAHVSESACAALDPEKHVRKTSCSALKVSCL